MERHLLAFSLLIQNSFRCFYIVFSPYISTPGSISHCFQCVWAVLRLSTHSDLMVLDLASHHAEGIVAGVVVDVDSAEARGAAGWDPLLIGIVVHHDSGSRLADTLFTAKGHTERKRKTALSCEPLSCIIQQIASAKVSDLMVKDALQVNSELP